MADNKTVFTLEFQDGGTIKAKTNDVKALNNETGKAVAAAKAMSNTYDQARAGGEGTGAAGRDFAKQAQGLGGLVRVYATFAANIFAVTAAFSALSNAADTSNLVKGLDQLGAASGKNLGTLSKKIVEVTDNSVSLREAMTATAQASAAGMSTSDILKLAKGAKQASQALGIDMSDALSRLSRGITKIEPELLDELGIFVRVDKAAQDYATAIGKPVSALTEFEKRASFSAAVLTQLNLKFGSLNIDANPYNQLLASLKNVSTAALDLVNRVLGPLVSMLASNPTGLLLIMGAIAATLLKQAIPALSSWRENLEKTRAATADAAAANKEMYDTYRSGIIEKDVSKQAMAFKAASNAVSIHIEALQNLDGINKRTALAKSITTFTAAPTAENAAIVQKLATQRALNIEELKAKGVSAERLTAYNAEAATIKTSLMPAIDGLLGGTKDLTKSASEYIGVKTGWWSLAAQYERIDKSAKAAATSIQIVSNAADNAKFGTLNALIHTSRELAKAYSDQNIGKVGAFFTAIKAGSAIAMVSISTLVNSMSGILNVIGIVIAFGTLLTSFFTKNSKEASLFSSAVDDLTASFDNADRTLAIIAKKDPLGQLSVTSIQARANAFMEVVDKVEESTKAFDKLKAATTNWLDTSTNWIKGWVGKDAATVMATDMTNAISKALALLQTTGEKDALSKSLRTAIGIDNLNDKDLVTETFRSALVGGNAKLVNEFKKALGASGRAAASSASDLTGFSNALTQATKSQQEYLNTFNLTGPLAKLGIDLLLVAKEMDKLKDSTKDSGAALLELLTDTKKMSLFGVEYASGLLSIKSAYESSTADIQKYNSELEEQKAKLDDLIIKRKENNDSLLKSLSYGFIGGGSSQRAKDEAASLEAITAQTALAAQTESKKGAAEAVKRQANIDAQKIIADGMYNAFQKGSVLINQALKNASAEAAVTLAKGATGLLTGTASLDAQAKIADMTYKIQVDALNVNESLILVNSRLENTFAIGNKLKQLELIQKDAKLGETSPEWAAARESLIATIQVGNILSGSAKEIVAAAKGAQGAEKGSTSALVGQQLSVIATSLAGTQASRTTLNAGRGALATEQAGVTPAAKLAEGKARELAQTKALNVLELDRLSIINDIVGVTSSEAVLAKNKLDIANQMGDATITQATMQAKIEGLQAQLTTEGGKELAVMLNKEQKLEILKQIDAAILDQKKLQNLEDKGSLAFQIAKEQAAARELTLIQSKRNLASDIATNQLDIESAIIAKKLELGKITIDQANAEEYANSVTRIRKDTTINLSKAQDDLNTLTKTFEDRSLEGPISDLGLLNSEYDRNSAILRNNIIAIEAKGAASLKVAEISKKNSEKETAYATLFTNSVGTMSDALVDFAFTGKHSFSEMITSMITDLVKLQMRMMATQAIAAANGPSSIFGSIGSMFGMGSLSGVSGVTRGSQQDLMLQAQTFGMANGGAYDNGVQAFAKGGAFTNSVVSSPTLFKFAKGTGMMGEAGPEAIMPLTRNSKGVLGVEGGGSSGGETNVIIHNYGPSKTETKKTIDSRGNKTIEVTIGDAVAGEIRRSGSPAQESIKSTFGRQPQLIRR